MDIGSWRGTIAAGAASNANGAKGAAAGAAKTGEKKFGGRRQRNGDGAKSDSKVDTKGDASAPAPASTPAAASNFLIAARKTLL